MSGDNLLCAQLLKFFSEEMTKTKWIALVHFKEKLVPVSSSVIYLKQKLREFRVPEAA